MFPWWCWYRRSKFIDKDPIASHEVNLLKSTRTVSTVSDYSLFANRDFHLSDGTMKVWRIYTYYELSIENGKYVDLPQTSGWKSVRSIALGVRPTLWISWGSSQEERNAVHVCWNRIDASTTWVPFLLCAQDSRLEEVPVREFAFFVSLSPLMAPVRGVWKWRNEGPVEGLRKGTQAPAAKKTYSTEAGRIEEERRERGSVIVVITPVFQSNRIEVSTCSQMPVVLRCQVMNAVNQ